jgi:hypothetical protein
MMSLGGGVLFEERLLRPGALPSRAGIEISFPRQRSRPANIRFRKRRVAVADAQSARAARARVSRDGPRVFNAVRRCEG